MNKDGEPGGCVSGHGVGKQWGVSAGPIKVMWKRAVLCRKQFPGIQKGGEVFNHHFFSTPQNHESQKLGEGQHYQGQGCERGECTEDQNQVRDAGKACW